MNVIVYFENGKIANIHNVLNITRLNGIYRIERYNGYFEVEISKVLYLSITQKEV